jgi:hypothetical protein
MYRVFDGKIADHFASGDRRRHRAAGHSVSLCVQSPGGRHDFFRCHWRDIHNRVRREEFKRRFLRRKPVIAGNNLVLNRFASPATWVLLNETFRSQRRMASSARNIPFHGVSECAVSGGYFTTG